MKRARQISNKVFFSTGAFNVEESSIFRQRFQIPRDSYQDHLSRQQPNHTKHGSIPLPIRHTYRHAAFDWNHDAMDRKQYHNRVGISRLHHRCHLDLNRPAEFAWRHGHIVPDGCYHDQNPIVDHCPWRHHWDRDRGRHYLAATSRLRWVRPFPQVPQKIWQDP